MDNRFSDRAEAGRALAPKLRRYAGRSDVIVLALPRGGVPVGAEVAGKLRIPLDVLVVRKVGLPGHEELAMGAVASGGVVVPNDSVIASFGVSTEVFEDVVRRESAELERRERAYRGVRPRPSLRGRTVILVDDGIATGSTMRAAVRAIRAERPAAVVVAAPVASADAVKSLDPLADGIVTVLTTDAFAAVGQFYRRFSQTTDDEVVALLSASPAPPGG